LREKLRLIFVFVRSRIDRIENLDNLYDSKFFFQSEAIEYTIRRNIQIPPRRISFILCSLCSGRTRTTEYVEAS